MIRQYLAPAKINLYLHVLGRRPDGYHDLAMIMQRVSLYDRIEIALVERPGVRVDCKGVDLPPGGENIGAVAARRLLGLAGIGDVLEKVEGLPSVWYVLVNPGVAVSTAWVYQSLGLTSGGGAARLPRFSGPEEGLAALLRNDLEKVTASRYPVVDEIKARLLASGASGALMSGSGPTVFGVYAEEKSARRAAEAFSGDSGWKVFVVRPV